MALELALIVDDSKSARESLSRLLGKCGMKVDLVASAEQAFQYLDRRQPDLIFMDHLMPGIDGLTATKKIKSDSKTATIPIVMYTSNEDAYYRQKAMEAGVTTILSKPASAHKLEQILAQIKKFHQGFTSKIIAEKEQKKEQEWGFEPTPTAGTASASRIGIEASAGLSVPTSNGPNPAVQTQHFWAEVDHRIREQGKHALEGTVATAVQKYTQDVEGKMQVKIMEEINLQLVSKPQMNTGLKALIESVVRDIVVQAVEKQLEGSLAKNPLSSDNPLSSEDSKARLKVSKTVTEAMAVEIAEQAVSAKLAEWQGEHLPLNGYAHDRGPEKLFSDEADHTRNSATRMAQIESNLDAQLSILAEEVTDLQTHFNRLLDQFGANVAVSQRFEALELGPVERIRRGFRSVRLICYLSALTAGFALVMGQLL